MERKTITDVPRTPGTKRPQSGKAAAKRYAEGVERKSAPEKFAKLLAVVNQLPAEIISGLTPNPQEWEEKLPGYDCLMLPEWERPTPQMIVEMGQIFKGLPRNPFVIGGGWVDTTTEEGFRSARRYYLLLLAARETLQNIELTAEGDVVRCYFAGYLHFADGLIRGKDDTLKRDHSRFTSFFADVEPSRVRVCPICKLIFWAGRRDAKACSKRCGNNRRIRKFRRKQRETQGETREQEV